MKDYELLRKATVQRPLEEVFAFFANPRNLETLTPPWLNFRITTTDPISMKVGARIAYRLSIRGLPITWISEITAWEPPYRFVDTQIKGPYRKWVHEHRFRSVEAGTEVVDHVEYRVPGGSLVNRFLVRPEVEKIFDYRGVHLRDRLGNVREMSANLEKRP